MTDVLWVDATAGASGDMLLGALADLVGVEVIEAAVAQVARLTGEPLSARHSAVRRQGLAATKVDLDGTASPTSRTWADVRGLLVQLPDQRLAAAALGVFSRLASAEARVHGTEVDEVHFHEVGALDALGDVVGVCAGLLALGEDLHVVVSPVAVGSGRVSAEHGSLPVPAPAVTELLRDVPTTAGPGTGEACTPTGAALLTTFATSFGPQPTMSVTRVGVGAGGRDPETHPNVLRLLLGTPASYGPDSAGPLLLETNVDDLDPRLWPRAIEVILRAGASDAWLTPILMKKGRPAHTLHVLTSSAHLPAVRRAVYAETSTIGMRETPVGKHALDRAMVQVTVDGHSVDVKVASLDGEVLNVQPEYEHVVAAAEALGRPAKEVLAEAAALARQPTSRAPS